MNAQYNIATLAKEQANLFVQNNVAYITLLVTGNCCRHILLMAYERLVRGKTIVAIENQSPENKESAWQTAKEIAAGRLSRSRLIELVKALIALEYYLNQ